VQEDTIIPIEITVRRRMMNFFIFLKDKVNTVSLPAKVVIIRFDVSVFIPYFRKLST